MKTLKFKKMRDTAIAPEFKTEGAVAMDFYASLDGLKENTQGLGDKELVILPGVTVPVPLGVAVALEPGYEMRIRPRSSMLLKGVRASIEVFSELFVDGDEKVGTIDSDYRGELHAIILNMSETPIVIEEGDRICQGVITKVECPGSGLKLEEVNELDVTERNDGKFGSTDR